MNRYIKEHFLSGKYIDEQEASNSGVFHNKLGWVDHLIGNDMIFSHRKTHYTRQNFPEALHAHDFFEVSIYIDGNIDYINENTLIVPSPFSVVWFRPGTTHSARLLASSDYERYIMYFTEDFFSDGRSVSPMTDFMSNSGGGYLDLPGNECAKMKQLLENAETAADSKKAYGKLLLKALIIEIFDIINSTNAASNIGENPHDSMLKVKQYIDNEYTTLTSVAEIAESFFYSREHLSRQFKASFNISISEYIEKKRIRKSLELLQSINITDAAYEVGFRSQSAFIEAFKRQMHCLPSVYRSSLK